MATMAFSTDRCCELAITREPSSEYRFQLRAMVAEAMRDGSERIVINCQAWERFDLGLLSTLICSARLCAEKGVEFEVTNLRRTVRSDIDALRLSDRLNLGSYNSRSDSTVRDEFCLSS